MKPERIPVQILDAKSTQVSDEDIRMLVEIELHPKVQEWDTDVHTQDAQEMYRMFKKFFEELPENEDQIFLIARVAKRTVGFVGIHRLGGLMRHVGEVGIAVHPDYQSRGIGTKLLTVAAEVARKKGFERLEADTLANNKPMIRIAQKVGFNLEAVRKMRIKRNGKYLDEALLALTL